MPFKVGVLGAGAVGAYVGGLIAAREVDVVMVGRRRFVDQVSGWRDPRPDPRGRATCTASRAMHVTVDDDPKALAGCDIVLVAVKSTATADAAAQLERIAERGKVPPTRARALASKRRRQWLDPRRGAGEARGRHAPLHGQLQRRLGLVRVRRRSRLVNPPMHPAKPACPASAFTISPREP